MKKWLSLFTSEEFIVIALILVLVFFSYYPLLLQYFAHPPLNRVFLGSVGYPPDFWGNIISFQEGRLGHWDFTTKITSTLSSSPSLLKMEYRFLGQINRLIPINQVIFFHISRLGLTVILLLIIYKLISKIFKTKTERLAAFTLALFSTAVGTDSQNLIYLWTPLGVFQRLAYYPHYLFGFIFVLLAIITLGKSLKSKNLYQLTLACLFGFLTSAIHASNTVTLFFSFPFYFLLIAIDNLRAKVKFSKWLYKPIFLAIFGLVSSLPLFYIFSISHIFPWNLLSKTDLKTNLSRLTTPEHFLTGIGPTLIFGLLGSYFIYKKKDDLSRLILPWSFTYLFGFWFIWRLFSYNSNRFLQTPFFVMLGILTTVFFQEISQKIFPKNTRLQNRLLIGLVILTIGFSLPATKYAWDLNRENFEPVGDYLYYSQPGNLAAIDWLGKNTKENEIVLADKINAELVSALAGNYCYITVHATELDNFYDLENNIIFFYQQTDPRWAEEFLKINHINYVFWSDNERILSGVKDLNYSFLTRVFGFENAEVWKVNN